ncbi:hypothetical protein GCM10023320_57910 [Pseudonocardia adelaidensis]|uniref:Uncharacterized protein n=1 Tax=Pseudonocardia adelaidensis TaxID=648754 RepID=A0ABP9NS71_9PSEU
MAGQRDVDLPAFTSRKGAPVGDIVYVSEVRIERENGPVRRAYLPAEADPVYYGTHGPVAEHYGHARGQFPEHATTLDHVVGAAAG